MLLLIEPVQVMLVGAVYDRAFCPRINEIRAVIDRAYRRLAITQTGSLWRRPKRNLVRVAFWDSLD